MKLFLTFDIEIWCGGWADLDARFPAAFERYIYGRSAAGEFALPKTLEILNRHALHGVFFVEPLFSARFGAEYLHRVCQLILDAGQEVQLHLHPEWTDEIRPQVFPARPEKRQHLSYYDQAEQIRLIELGRRLLEEATGTPVTAFRAGSFAANEDTLAVLRTLGIGIDSSINIAAPISAPGLAARAELVAPVNRDGLRLVPISVFRDGFGRIRQAQIGACGFTELTAALSAADQLGYAAFTLLSHNFELLRSGSSRPDSWVVRRFERLCAFLDRERKRFPTVGFSEPLELDADAPLRLPLVGLGATLVRHYEQLRRRLDVRMATLVPHDEHA